jgi:hypothetical protein
VPYKYPSADITTVPGTGSTKSATNSPIPAAHAQLPASRSVATLPSSENRSSHAPPQIIQTPSETTETPKKTHNRRMPKDATFHPTDKEKAPIRKTDRHLEIKISG